MMIFSVELEYIHALKKDCFVAFIETRVEDGIEYVDSLRIDLGVTTQQIEKAKIPLYLPAKYAKGYLQQLYPPARIRPINSTDKSKVCSTWENFVYFQKEKDKEFSQEII